MVKNPFARLAWRRSTSMVPPQENRLVKSPPSDESPVTRKALAPCSISMVKLEAEVPWGIFMESSRLRGVSLTSYAVEAVMGDLKEDVDGTFVMKTGDSNILRLGVSVAEGWTRKTGARNVGSLTACEVVAMWRATRPLRNKKGLTTVRENIIDALCRISIGILKSFS